MPSLLKISKAMKAKWWLMSIYLSYFCSLRGKISTEFVFVKDRMKFPYPFIHNIQSLHLPFSRSLVWVPTKTSPFSEFSMLAWGDIISLSTYPASSDSYPLAEIFHCHSSWECWLPTWDCVWILYLRRWWGKRVRS